MKKFLSARSLGLKKVKSKVIGGITYLLEELI